MNKDTAQFKVISTRACIDYIEKSGLTIHDEADYQIKSKSGLVYMLPNNEVVLLPSNFDLDYPGIVFKNLAAFKHYAKLDFFPIGEDNMTWFELYNDKIKQFRENPVFYDRALEALHITIPFKSYGDIRSAFLKVQSFISSGKRKDLSFEQVHIICSFGLAVTNYLIDNEGYNLVLEDGYENYNPITRVLIEKKGELKDILTTCLIFCEVNSPDAADMFMKSLNN